MKVCRSPAEIHTQHPLADEIIAEAGDACIGDDPPILDLRVDERDGAEAGRSLRQVFAVEADRIAGLQEARMALRHPQTQHEILLGDRGDRFAAHHHAAHRHRHGEHAPGGRRQHIAFGELLRHHGAFVGARLQIVRGDIGRRGQLIEIGLGRRAALEQALGTRKVALGLGQLRLQRLDLRVERALLEDQLGIADRRHDLVGLHPVALLDRETGDGAAGADAGRDDVETFDGGEHRLVVGRRDALDGIGRCRPASAGEQGKRGRGQENGLAHGEPSLEGAFSAAVDDASAGGIERDGRKPCCLPGLNSAGHVCRVGDPQLQAFADGHGRTLAGAAVEDDLAAFRRRQGFRDRRSTAETAGRRGCARRHIPAARARRSARSRARASSCGRQRGEFPQAGGRGHHVLPFLPFRPAVPAEPSIGPGSQSGWGPQ